MESIWQKDSKLPSFPQQKGKQKTEVLIIGGGITGILTAYFLTQNHVDCMLVEKGKICNGTTAGTTAKITVQHGLLYHRLLKNYGAEFAQKYLQANQRAFTCYETLCKNMDCDFVYRDNYVYAIDNREKLEQELTALEKIGYPAAFCEHLPLPFSTAGAVTFSHQAQFHPLKFLAAIAEGLPIYENMFVKQLQGNTAITDTA